MTSWSDARVIKGADADALESVEHSDVRSAHWTRFGGDSVRGDEVTEDYLGSIAAAAKLAAQSQGYATGWAEGRRRAAEEAAVLQAATEAALAEQQRQLAEEHHQAMSRLAHAAASLEEAVAEATAAVDGRATQLVLELLEVLLGHELQLEGGFDVVRRALSATPPTDLAVIRMNPRQVADVLHLEEGPAGEAVRIEADHNLDPGDAIVVVGDHLVDLRINRAMARIKEGLK